jgi:hypothetical protein
MYFDFFAELLRSLPAASRRGVLTSGLAAILPAALRLDGAEARRKRKRHRQRKHRQPQNPTSPPSPPPGPGTHTDAICAGSGESNLGGSGNIRLAQTFTALTSGPLLRADLLITKLAGSLGEYILQVGQVDAFGEPTNDVLASTSVANLAVPDGQSTVSFNFGNPATVVASTQYSLVLSRPDSTHLQWQGQNGDACAGRAFASVNQSGEFLPADVDLDLVFTTFVTS